MATQIYPIQGIGLCDTHQKFKIWCLTFNTVNIALQITHSSNEYHSQRDIKGN